MRRKYKRITTVRFYEVLLTIYPFRSSYRPVMKLWHAIAMAAALLGAVSCAPIGTYGDGAEQAATQAGTEVSKVPIGSAGSGCLLYTSPSPRDKRQSRMPSSA